MASKRIEQKLARLTRQFFARHPDVKLVAVTGSAGKTSTKIAIGTVLSQSMNIQLREEEPKTKSDVFLQIMGVRLPEKGPFRWQRAIKAVKQRVDAEHPGVQVIVQEFSPKDIGYNGWFRDYLLPDIAVITSVSNGRMEVEHSLEEVAQEMISLANNSKTAIINRDDIEGRFASFLTNPHISTYGNGGMAEYYFDEHSFSLDGGRVGAVMSPEYQDGLSVRMHLLGEHNIRPSIAAIAVGYRLGMNGEDMVKGIDALRPLPGRMNLLRGSDDTWLIDDSYSSTPQTALSALQTLYSLDSPQRIAVFGSMNGLKGVHQQAHAELGSQCQGEMLDWVVTVGDKANQYLAPAARQNGCQVHECRDAIEAGAFVRGRLKSGGVALFKGSSGGVWLEEAVKINLSSTSDQDQLVRQSSAWLAHKNDFFSRFPDNSDAMKRKTKALSLIDE